MRNYANVSTDPELINRVGLSRKHIFDAVDASLKRLGVDYIDLYQIHRLDTVSIQLCTGIRRRRNLLYMI